MSRKQVRARKPAKRTIPVVRETGRYEDLATINKEMRHSVVPDTSGLRKLIEKPGFAQCIENPDRFFRNMKILRRDTERLIGQINELEKHHPKQKTGRVKQEDVVQVISTMEGYNALATRYSMVSGPSTQEIANSLTRAVERHNELVRQAARATPQAVPVGQVANLDQPISEETSNEPK